MEYFKHEFKNDYKERVIEVTEFSEIESALLESEFNINFGTKSSTEFISTNIPCQIDTQSLDYFDNFLAWGFPKNSSYLEIINYNLHRIKQAGVLQRLWEKYMRKDSVSSCEKKAVNPVQIVNLMTAFIILLIGVITSIAFAVIEFCLKKLTSRISKNEKFAAINVSIKNVKDGKIMKQRTLQGTGTYLYLIARRARCTYGRSSLKTLMRKMFQEKGSFFVLYLKQGVLPK